MIQIAMSDAQYAAASKRLHANGIDLSGPSGTLTKDGITASYAHADGKLTIEIVDKPSLLPLSLIEAKLKVYLDQSVAYDTSRESSAV
jgi:hypothetical protein